MLPILQSQFSNRNIEPHLWFSFHGQSGKHEATYASIVDFDLGSFRNYGVFSKHEFVFEVDLVLALAIQASELVGDDAIVVNAKHVFMCHVDSTSSSIAASFRFGIRILKTSATSMYLNIKCRSSKMFSKNDDSTCTTEAFILSISTDSRYDGAWWNDVIFGILILCIYVNVSSSSTIQITHHIFCQFCWRDAIGLDLVASSVQMYWIKIQIDETTTGCGWIEWVAFTNTTEELVVLHIIKIPSTGHHVMFSVCVGQIGCATAATLCDVWGTSVDCWSSWIQRSAIHIQEACWINNQISGRRVKDNMTSLNRWVHSHVPICFSRFVQWYRNLASNSICSLAS